MSASRRSKSSRRWLDRHVNDDYVHRARAEGYRSRAAYKLLELQQRDALLRPGMTVVDLGAAPGGWSQVAATLVGKRGRIIAMDLLAMDPIDGVEFIQADFREDAALAQLHQLLDGQAVDLVLSDMAPNVSGMKAVDQPRSIYLVELALDFAASTLKPGGCLAVKAFHGEGFDDLVRTLRSRFERVVSRKPKASRPQSRETYLVAKGFRVG
ncbi:23S rRNA (uridine(2552)-2'-O)-methyltransferase RlmE [Thiohalocapsa marina]|uniref:23S rRNA (uridine(2552)-2'-O)-methyltransferase RlmE n=1 Tax=Thiohalocapsa marina TaxID=424902 RepID=UPI001FE5AACD|nr:23S rRNA (uridine(2552)-2'-O)-methyltransferase RlmE [Thiohalocapsa marina]